MLVSATNMEVIASTIEAEAHDTDLGCWSTVAVVRVILIGLYKGRDNATSPCKNVVQALQLLLANTDS